MKTLSAASFCLFLQVLDMYPEFCDTFWSNLEITFNLGDVCVLLVLFINTLRSCGCEDRLGIVGEEEVLQYKSV